MSDNPKPNSKAYAQVVEAVIERRLVPGALVTQRELVEICGMPLSSVREAIPRLEADGILTSGGKRGLQIATISPSFIRNAYQLRLILEKEAFAALLGRGSAAMFADLRKRHESILARLDDEVSRPLIEEAQQVDWDFHDQAIAFLQNGVISEVYGVNAIKVRMAIQPQLQINASNLMRVVSEHVAIIERLEKRDFTGTMAALELHIRNSRALALGQEPVLLATEEFA